MCFIRGLKFFVIEVFFFQCPGLIKEYQSVKDAYEKSLALRPDDPHVLNNLAWLYTGNDDPSMSNPQRALVLAKMAIELDQSSHVLQTNLQPIGSTCLASNRDDA